MILNEDWEFNILGVYNYRKPGQLTDYFNFLRENHERIEGDICEAGVFKGRSLLGAALMLKELGSKKIVYGYDTFEGFPPIYNENDDMSKFEFLLNEGRITQEHFDKMKKNTFLRESTLAKGISEKNISLSGDFSSANIDDIKRKIEILELDNVRLMKGPFERTMTSSKGPEKVFAAILDCDLYMSYMVCLPYFWDRIPVGGYVYLDEYYSLKFAGARIASDEFFRDKQDKPQMHNKTVGDFERWFVRKLHAS